jgi:hypothetical protein
MGNSYKSGLMVAFATFSVLGLSGCGDEPEPNQAPSESAHTAQSSVTPPAETSPAPAPDAQTAAAPQPAPAEVPAYHATLEEGIDFKKPGYPDFITEVTGVSGREDWGRWTDGAAATFKFKDSLPKQFTLLVEAGAIGDNLGKPIKFRVGSVEKECVFKGDPFGNSRVATLHFNSAEPGNTLVVTIPAPMTIQTDSRKLGVGLITMKIDTSGKI